MLRSLLFFGHVDAGGLEHEFFRAHLFERHLDEPQTMLDELEKSRETDIRRQFTGTGPHKDDLSFFINNRNARIYGSQGQQRTSALSLKLSEISLVKKNINSTPVLLLDDVLSELDGNRQNYLLNSLSDTQTIITCTGLDEFVKNRFQVDKVFHVVKGQVEVIDE